MLLSPQFIELFREEQYAVNLALMDDVEFDNPYDDVLADRPIEGLWTKEYSVVPIGELGGRREAEPIPQKNMVMGYECEGAISIEGSGKVNLSKRLQQRSREFVSNGQVDERRFAGHLADSIGRAFEMRWAQRRHRLCADLFNLGGIQAGNVFFNHRTRVDGMVDLTNTNLIYDGSPLFALPANSHQSYAARATVGPTSAAVGTTIDFAATIPDTGGYFNAFQFPPSYWALKRVITHFKFNMQFDENDERYQYKPDTLLVSSYNTPRWMEILESKFIEPTAAGNTTNRENVFMMEGYRLRLVEDPYLVANTWYVGRANSFGIRPMSPTPKEDPWAFYRDEDNRSYFISYEQEWGFIVKNWRCWVGGSIATDGETAPDYGAEDTWDEIPAGV
jgi:hypothetical protein